jgi:hypothetical protein
VRSPRACASKGGCGVSAQSLSAAAQPRSRRPGAATPHLRRAPALTPTLRRRPSYHEPRSPTADGEVEIGVAYSQEEEMTGRLHDQMIENSKKSQANLAAATAA